MRSLQGSFLFPPPSHLEDGAANNEREERITDVPPLKCLSLYTSIRPLFGRCGEGGGIISVAPEASFL